MGAKRRPGRPPEMTDAQRLHCMIPRALHATMTERAQRDGITLAELVRRACDEYLARGKQSAPSAGPDAECIKCRKHFYSGTGHPTMPICPDCRKGGVRGTRSKVDELTRLTQEYGGYENE